jgi:WD40 repeat protein
MVLGHRSKEIENRTQSRNIIHDVRKISSLVVVIGLLTMSFMLVLTPVGVGGDDAGEMEAAWTFQAGDLYRQMAISDDGEYIVAGSYDNKAYLFNKDSSTPLWSYTTTDDVQSVAISEDGEYIVAGTEESDGRIYLWDKDDSTPLWSYQTTGGILSVDNSADGRYIAVATSSGYVHFFEKSSSTPVWSYQTGDKLFMVSMSGDGEYIAAGCMDNKIYFWDKDDSTPVWSYLTGDDVWAVDVSSTGDYIAAGSKDNRAYLFERTSSTPLWSYEADENVRSVDMSDDGEYIIAGSGDNSVYLFDKDSNTPLWSFETGELVQSVRISADGEYIAAGSFDENVYFFKRDSNDPLWHVDTNNQVYALGMSGDGNYIAAGSYENGKMNFFDRKVLNLYPSKDQYEQGDLVEIDTWFHERVADVSIQVKDSEDSTYFVDTIETNVNGRGTFEFLLAEDVPLGEWTVYGTNDMDDSTEEVTFMVSAPPLPPNGVLSITTFDVPASVAKGSDLEVEIGIENTYDDSQTVTIVIQVQAPNKLPLTPEIEIEVIGGSSEPIFTIEIPIPADADSGDYSVKGQLMTNLPESLGYPLDFTYGTTTVS